VTAELSVELVAWPQFRVPRSLASQYEVIREGAVVIDTDPPVSYGNGTDLVEFAGRACYESWDRPNAATATNEGYLSHILDVGHTSVLEHAQYTFWITGVSRALTHELVRHRHTSPSQLSQRYVDQGASDHVVPPVYEDDDYARAILDEHMAASQAAYGRLVEHTVTRLSREHEDWSATQLRKAARGAARAVMPEMTETKIVLSGNLRAWRHFIALRATEHADAEIRALAVEVFLALREVAPNAVQDGSSIILDDGSVVVVGIGTEE
jgi:thymidylate synthase (FAD)